MERIAYPGEADFWELNRTKRGPAVRNCPSIGQCRKQVETPISSFRVDYSAVGEYLLFLDSSLVS